MEVKAFDLLREAEDSWWYRARGQLVSRLYKKYLPVRKTSRPAQILDVGAGWGGMFEVLHQFGDISAYEPYAPAAEGCRDKGYVQMEVALDRFEKQGTRFDAAGAFDVLEHVEDDADLVRRVSALLPSGGLFVATVPAFQFLWSKHDVTHKHFRRYSRRQAIELFQENGFEVVYASYWNFLLFPLALIVRLLGFTGESSLKSGGLKDTVLGMIAGVEIGLMPPLRVPWGTGIAITGRKR